MQTTVVERNGPNLGLGDTSNTYVFKVILGSFSALVLKWTVSRKGLAIEGNGVKFDTHEY